MIQANEYSVGNLCVINSIGNRKEEGIINDKQLASWLLRKGEFSFEPIELTEDRLIKFGFEVEDDNAWFNGLVVIIRRRDGVDGRQRFEFLSDRYNPDLDYVHQLQNLNTALTGEELTIKEDSPRIFGGDDDKNFWSDKPKQ